MSRIIDTARVGFEAPASEPSPIGTDGVRGRRHQHWSSPFAARRIHLIGVGGSGMSGLAGVLLRCGAIVSGSDRAGFKALTRLGELGATIRIGHAPINLPSDCDAVIASAAITEDNPELLEARRRGLTCYSYAEMLGQVMRLRTGIAISGTHGKSTTTALTAFILRDSRLDPTFIVGAEAPQLSGSCGVGDGAHLVAEACEFRRSFLNLKPTYAAILNIEEDHLDYYRDIDDIVDAFHAFASQVAPQGIVLANADDARVERAVRGIVARVETFGSSNGAFWRTAHVDAAQGCYRFDLYRDGQSFLHASLDRLPGRHQVHNAAVAAALAHHAGVPADRIAAALSRFEGADRRMSSRGEVGGVLILDDYGHHPTEIRVTLRAIRERYPGRRLWVVFQPHQHSRTRFLLDDFARSFGEADHLLAPDIFFVRDSETEQNRISSRHLVERVRQTGGDALYLPTHDEIVDHVAAHVRAGDLVVTMGAGDVWKVADELVRRLA